MGQLYLLRHGIAIPHGAPGFPDDQRSLTPKGAKRIHQIARGLRRLGIELDRIVTSPLPRARKTAEIVADVLGIEDRLELADALRADRDAQSIRDWLPTRHEEKLMLVGHNPSFSDLVAMLVGGQSGAAGIELKKGGVAAFARNGSNSMQLDWLAPPRLLRRL